MFDVDHFKLINDTFGHAAGDSVLAQIAEICRANLREQDRIGRLGGEEFACLLPDITAVTSPAHRGAAARGGGRTQHRLRRMGGKPP